MEPSGVSVEVTKSCTNKDHCQSRFVLSLGTLIAPTLVDPGTDCRNTIVSFRISAPDETKGFVGRQKIQARLLLCRLADSS